MMTPATVRSNTSIDPALPRYETPVHMLVAAAEACPERAALVCGDAMITFGELGRAVAGLAGRLRDSRVMNTRVVILIPNSIETVVAAFGAMAAGAHATLVNPFFKLDELRPLLVQAEPSTIVCDASSHQKASTLAAEIGEPDVLTLGAGGISVDECAADGSRLGTDDLPAGTAGAAILFTGGTTGISKGVLHSHDALIYSVYQHCAMWPLDFEAERFLSVAPFFHIWGLTYACFVPVYTRNTLYIVPRYDPEEVLGALSEQAITVFAGGPAPIYAGLTASPLYASTDFSGLKYSLTGGAPCPEALHERWATDTGCPLLEGWGMTEAAPLCLTPARGRQKLLSVGLPVPGTELEIVDVETGNEVLETGVAGEVRVRGPQVMLGYLNDPEATARTVRDDWLYTGDIGHVDDDGYLYLVDRKKEMAIVGGYNVYPRQVDEVLAKHPAIREAASVGRSHDRLGEVIVAFVALESGTELTEDQFFLYCESQFVKYKRPVEVFFLDELPRTGVRKIDKLELKRRAMERKS